MEPVIRVAHLHKRYGATVAVDDVSFEVFRGEIFGILGPNGAGKTTTVECLQGLRTPSSGTLEILGVDPVRERGRLQGRVGSQLQASALPDRIKVWEALSLFASLRGSTSDWHTVMAEWGLTGQADTAFANLSGGLRQRLFVALALVDHPEVVFLDELTQGLDPAARRDAWASIRAIRERGATVVLVTHYMDEAQALCDRIAIINAGTVAAIGSPHTPQALMPSRAAQVLVRFTTDARDLSWLSAVDHVETIVRDGNRVEVRGSGPVLALVAFALVEHGIVPADLRIVQPSLEDIYFAVVGNDRKDVGDVPAA
jgi:ABC-2 type transport system ATP-binding protein